MQLLLDTGMLEFGILYNFYFSFFVGMIVCLEGLNSFINV